MALRLARCGGTLCLAMSLKFVNSWEAEAAVQGFYWPRATRLSQLRVWRAPGWFKAMSEQKPEAAARRKIRRYRAPANLEGFSLPPHERMPAMVVPTAGCRCPFCMVARNGAWDFEAYYAWLELNQKSSVQLELKLPVQSVQTLAIPSGNRQPKTVIRSVVEYERDPRVVAYARARAAGRCEVPSCTYEPFMTTGAQAYFEVHHIVPLHEAGPDTPDNVACICPRHHREIHFGARGTEINAQLGRLPGRSPGTPRP